jgi:NAD(P)-dependent dehydrogenase (short-subunit alcohol dehydrogenase family)
LSPVPPPAYAEWGARGVRVNAVAPTYINTPLTAFAKTNEAMFGAWIDGTPMARMGEPDEIAAVVLFLASDAASLMTRVDRAGRWRLYVLVGRR